MKYVKLNNDFQVDRKQNPTAKSNEELTLDWLSEGMMRGYVRGFSADQRRIALNLLDKMHTALDSKAEYLELNPIEYAFMKTGFAGYVSSAEALKPTTIAEDALLNAVNEIPVPGTATAATAA